MKDPEGQGKWWGSKGRRGVRMLEACHMGLFALHGVSLAAQRGLLKWVLQSAGCSRGK